MLIFSVDPPFKQCPIYCTNCPLSALWRSGSLGCGTPRSELSPAVPLTNLDIVRVPKDDVKAKIVPDKTGQVKKTLFRTSAKRERESRMQSKLNSTKTKSGRVFKSRGMGVVLIGLTQRKGKLSHIFVAGDSFITWSKGGYRG